MVELKLKKPTINQNIFFFIILYIIYDFVYYYYFNKTNAFTQTKLGVDKR